MVSFEEVFSLFGGFFVSLGFCFVFFGWSVAWLGFWSFVWFLGFGVFYSSSVAFPCDSIIAYIITLFNELNSLEDNFETQERTTKVIKKKKAISLTVHCNKPM